MNKQFLLYLFILAVSATITTVACKDDEEECIAGSGGNVTFVAKLAHHGTIIPNDSLKPDTVWVKFGASDWSGAPAGYDLRLIGDYPEDHVHIEGLKCGQYYLYASGWDTSISQVVKGGIPYSTDQTSGEIVVTIPVTE